MPVLKNSKHERIAQGLAQGLSASQSYIQAGYKPNRANASRLQRTSSISQRVAEILQQRDNIAEQSIAEAIKKTALTKEWVIERLVENVNRSMQAEAVMIAGEPTGEYVYNGTVANKSLELLGKELGMFIERSENINLNKDISAEPLLDDEWASQHCDERQSTH